MPTNVTSTESGILLPEHKLEYFVIWYDKKLTKLMQNADVFEAFKVIGKHDTVEVTSNSPIGIKEQLENLKVKFKASESEVGIVAIYSMDDPKIFYRNEDITVVSDGRQFATVDGIIKTLLTSIAQAAQR